MITTETREYEEGCKTKSTTVTERSDESSYKEGKFWGIVLVSVVALICLTIILYKVF